MEGTTTHNRNREVEGGKKGPRPRSEGKGETLRARDANKPLHEARATGGSNASKVLILVSYGVLLTSHRLVRPAPQHSRPP